MNILKYHCVFVIFILDCFVAVVVKTTIPFKRWKQKHTCLGTSLIKYIYININLPSEISQRQNFTYLWTHYKWMPKSIVSTNMSSIGFKNRNIVEADIQLFSSSHNYLLFLYLIRTDNVDVFLSFIVAFCTTERNVLIGIFMSFVCWRAYIFISFVIEHIDRHLLIDRNCSELICSTILTFNVKIR